MKIYGSEQMTENEAPISFTRSDYRFYGKPDIELVLEDYIKLPVMHEVFFELMPGVFMKDHSFDHILVGNVFALKGGASPMIEIKTSDCSGLEIRGNILHGGNGEFVGGQGKPEVLDGNKKRSSGSPDRPIPPVPSIYDWQQKLARKAEPLPVQHVRYARHHRVLHAEFRHRKVG